MLEFNALKLLVRLEYIFAMSLTILDFSSTSAKRLIAGILSIMKAGVEGLASSAAIAGSSESYEDNLLNARGKIFLYP